MASVDNLEVTEKITASSLVNVLIHMQIFMKLRSYNTQYLVTCFFTPPPAAPHQ